jgi:hypothetical protein
MKRSQNKGRKKKWMKEEKNKRGWERRRAQVRDGLTDGQTVS